MFAIPGAPTIAAATLSLALTKFAPEHLTLVALQSASESGRKGNRRARTPKPASFSRFNPSARPSSIRRSALISSTASARPKQESLSCARDRLRREVAAVITAPAKIPAVQLIQAPVFYGLAFTFAAKLATPADAAQLSAAAKSAGLLVNPGAGPSNLSVAGESSIQLSAPEPDASSSNLWWFFGAADNIRLPAFNAVKLAEKLLS